MDWQEMTRDREVAHWKRKYERTVKLCKCIWENKERIEDVKHYLDLNYELAAAEYWNELDYDTQKLLITAPRYGGPFTTQERKKIKELWEISADDIETYSQK